MPAEQRIQIKRRANEPSSASAWQGLLDGELGYIKSTNKLYIGNGKGETPTLISTLSWDELTGKPTSILSQIYLNSTDPTKVVYKKVGSNTEHTLGNFAPLTNGLIDLKYLPQGALERLVVVANATARLKLTTANVQLGDTVKETDTGLMYIVVDESKLNSEDGYQVYVAGRAAAVDWTGVENKVNATVSSAGLMSAADKKKLDNTNVAYGTCSTAASTTQKDIVITSQGNWSLQIGSIIVVKFTYTNTAQNPVFKVGNVAAKSVWYNTALISTSNLSYAGYANRPSMYMYDGTQFVWLGWTVDSNSDTKVTQSAAITTAGEYPVLLGYGTATTAVTDTVNKAAAFTYNPNTKVLTAETFKGKLTGNADTATKLKTARTISLTGDATGSASFDGSANASITVTVADDSHNHTISNIDNLQSNLDLKYDKAGGPISGHIYMTGSSASSSTANTTQLIFGTSSAQHVAVTSNDKALVINPNSSATTNQIVLYLNQQSVFPGGIKISAGNLNVSGTSTLTGAVTAQSTLAVTGTSTFTGAMTAKSTVTLAKDPVQNLEAATKQYVDNKVIAATQRDYVAKAGDTMTGDLLIEKSTYPGIALGNTTTGTRTNLQTWDNSSVLQCLLEAGNTDNRRGLFLKNSRAVSAVSGALTLRDWIDGTATEYNIYGEHNKPTPADIGAATSGHTHSNIVTAGDNRSVATVPSDYKNSLIFQGLKYNTTITLPSSASTTYSYLVGLRGWSDNSGGKAHELAFNNDGLFIRDGETDSWGGWRRVYDSSHKPTPADIGAPTTTGSGASGTWGISISGNAATATSAKKATKDGNGATIASTYLKLAGGTMTGNITRNQVGQSWIDVTHGRACAIKLSAAASGGSASCLWSVKTNAGAWGCGGLSGNNNMYFSYGTDTNYNAGTNTLSGQIIFTPSGGIVVASNTEYTTYKVRNIAAGTSGSPANNGDIFIKYS